ncbi:hypothetical protein Q9L58_005862 [Maublancomyces gigas]|uniref:H-type lectin domain-containing protein n=1 Tax=Discina gigas TaxID=1032678 RepID=A0ABR3GI15_9PEZI
MSNPTPYIPAPHLIASSRLTAQELVSHFQDFSNTLRYVSTAPELVFERLVEHLSENLKTTFEVGWQERSNTPQASQLDYENLAAEWKEKYCALEARQLADDILVGKLQEESSALQASQLANTNLAAELQEKCSALQASLLANKKLTAELAKWKEKIPAPGLSSRLDSTKAVVKTNPTIGTFTTIESDSCQQGSQRASKTFTFGSKYNMVPGLVVGLTYLDVACGENVRVNAYPSEIKRDRFKINLDTWNDTTLYYATCAWLAIEADDMDFQYGSYHTIEDHDIKSTPLHNTRIITFKRKYPTAPTVVVWLNVIDLGSAANWRIKTFATNVTATGFTIHIDTWADTKLYAAMASWVAYPTDRSGVASGCFSTLDIRSPGQEQAFNSAFESFGTGVFEKPPKLFLALNALDIDCRATMRLLVKADNVSATGMTWHLNSWRDSSLYSAGASYIAFR